MSNQKNMPKEKGLDHTLSLLQEGYQFIINRRHTMQSNVFETKLLGEKAICLSGSEAAKVFYDNDKFKREGAAPKPVQKTLFGKGGVQGLDGEAHRHRKAMFMSLMSKDDLKEIRQLTKTHWEKAAKDWESQDEIVLYEEVKKILTKVACEWTGVPLKEEEVEDRADLLSEMFETPAEVNLNHFKGWRARSKAEKWIETLVEEVRSNDREVEKGRALYAFTWHKDHEGKLLDENIVAVELINLLRPIVAISVYIAFTGLAINQYPEKVTSLAEGEEDKLQWFIQEVRRYYPFFPFTAAKVKETFTWEGYTFEKDTLTLLDLYGTNHHPDDWDNPDRFEPERFAEWSGSPFNFIPQGGGEFDIGHRCAGEWITIDILKESLNYLVNHLDYTLPEQDLSFSMTEIPAIPKSKIKMTNVKRT
ncbi:cytochrome P450 [Salipaludibacillus keqinensis]|uniref:Cytochrome P450 n=1 Tax=Salipaludibacillus keqinensis TaxID=2045207 RepID=A0A323TLX4_9BACI|nr:cytochrome P450 [Salipaludibacillus keqinensis]PYZ94984.1 cytochrome P450 [Salipaludibacillus keqinensis]